MMDYDVRVHVDNKGSVTRLGEDHDGFPSYEVWSYPTTGDPMRIYYHDQGGPWNALDLFGAHDTKVPPSN